MTFLYKDPDYKSDDNSVGVPVWVSIDKNRDGTSGVRFPFIFFKEFTRFESGTLAVPVAEAV